MAIKRFPPAYSETKKYPPQYDLDKIDVYLNAEPGDYFNITGLPTEIGFGKHAFTIFVSEPDGGLPLKDYGNILIEAKDADGSLIFSGITNKTDISGASICYIWVKQDPLRTSKNIVDGFGTLTVVGQLANVPNQYKDVYNLRTTFPLNIRKSFPNLSPILLQSSSLVQNTITVTEKLEADIDNTNFNRSYADITIPNLKTYGGQIDSIQISYLESGSTGAGALTENDYTFLTQQTIQTTSASFEDEIDHRISDGLNPISQSFRVLMPPMANQSGSDFGLDDNRFRFKFEFLNKNNEKAKEISSNQDLIITSSYIDFAGPATVIGGEGNLIDGQLFLGNVVGKGMEFSAQNSAFVRSIGYLGFTSASAGSGSGFMLYSGSVLGANTDDYELGGVGFEFVSSSEAFMRFNTNPGIFDVRAKSFFVGSEATQFISGSGNNIEISASGFHLTPEGNVTMSGQLAVDAGGTIGGFTIGTTGLSTDAFILSSSQNQNDPVSFISSSAFKVSAGGGVSASSMYIDGAFITGSTDLDVKTIRAAGVNIGGAGNTADGQISTTQITASIISASDHISSSEAHIPSLTAQNITFKGNFSGSASESLKTTITANRISGSDGGFFGGAVNVEGNVTAETFTTVEIGSDFSSGNTTFGNSPDDKHRFTGSINLGTDGASGSIDNVFVTGKYISGSSVTTGSFIKATIGTAKPAVGQALTIQGNISSSGTGSFDGGAVFGGRILIKGNSGGDTKISFTDSTQNIQGTSDYIIIESDNQFVVKADNKVNIDTPVMGVGVFTTGDEADTLLHLSASGETDNTELTIDSQQNAGIILDSGRDGGDEESRIYFKGNDDLKWQLGKKDNSNHDFHLYNQKGGKTSLYVVGGSNNYVGIGTTSPTRELQVTGNISASGGFTLGKHGTSTFVSMSNGIISGSDLYSQNQYLGEYMYHLDDTNTYFRFLDDRVVIVAGNNTYLDFNDGVTLGHTGKTSTLQGVNISLTGPVTASSDLQVDGDISGSSISVTGNGTIVGNLDVDGTTNLDVVDIDGNVDVDGNLVVGEGNISSPTFFSGFAGSGFQISTGSAANGGKTSFTIDDLTVRNQMSVYELLIHQIRATNGSLFVSNTGKIISASLDDGDKKYSLFFDTGSGYGHSFRIGDLIRAQRFQPDANGSGSEDGTATYKSDLMIISTNDTTSSIAVLTGSDASAPQAGFEYVRIGNTSTGSRQGTIYMTADEANAPFIDVVDDITAHSEFGTTGKVKLRMGKLSGVNSNTFGQLGSGLHKYGFYASGSAFLEGGINATRGTIGNWSIGFNKISSSNIVIDASNQIISLGNTTFGNSGVQLKYDGNGQLHAGSSATKFIKFDGTDVSISSPNFTLSTGGNISASNAQLSGRLVSKEGKIGGFAIGETALSSSNFTLSASSEEAEVFISHSSFKVKNSGQITASALLLTGSTSPAGTNFLLYNNGKLTVRGDVAASTLSTPSASISEGGNLVATSGSIGGFNIDSNNLYSSASNRITMSNNNGGIIALKDKRFGEDGIQLSSSGEFFVGKKLGEHIKFDGSSTFVSSSKFFIGSSEQFISGSNGTLQIRSQDAIISGSDIKILTPSFLLGDVSSSISGGNGVINISGSNIELQTPNFLLGSPSTFISGSSTGVQISGSDVEIFARNIFLGDVKHSFISGGLSGSTGQLEISSSAFHLTNAGNLTISGTISASKGNIGGWTLDTNKLKKGDDFELAPTSTYIISSSNFKVKGTGEITGSSALLDGGQIGGFVLGTNQISASGVVLNTSNRGTGGQITASAGLIGGFTLTTESIAIGNIKLSSEEKGLIISSSGGAGRLKVASGSLSSTVGTAGNLFLNSGFEDDDSGDSGQDVLYWGINSSTINLNDTNNYFLWHSGSISVNVTASSGESAAGSKHFEVFVQREDKPIGGGATAGGASGGGGAD